jgi:membrane-associated protease RseP (regulator of RpoE activity)
MAGTVPTTSDGADLGEVESLPDPAALPDVFHVYEVERTDDGARYYGEPTDERDRVVQRVAPQFRDRGYRVSLTRETGEHVLVATERSTTIDGVPWLNVVLFLATVATTLLAGVGWYGDAADAGLRELLGAWPFAASVLVVLAVHELGHYVASRYHDVEATLPYFVPVPSALGTLGAVIRMKDHLPDREALFDIGVAGPLAGLVATVVVTAVGVSLPPVEVSGGVTFATQYDLGYPPLVQFVALALEEPLRYGAGRAVNPVLVGGWVGAFVTFLNMLPVGQLDGAHVARALAGESVERLQYVVPVALLGLAAGVAALVDPRSATVWVVWGLLALFVGRAGTATPLSDEPVGRGRIAVGVLAFLLGALCFTPVPITLVG